MTEMKDSDGILRCPLGLPTRSMQNCDFGRTLFKGLAEASPSKTALCDVSTKECISYKSFVEKAEITARHLLRHGCRKGDVIALFAPNSIDWLVVVAASFRIGLVPAGINYVHKAEEVHRQLILSGAKFLFSCCGQHLETALHSLAGTKVHTLFCVGKDNEVINGGENYNGGIIGKNSAQEIVDGNGVIVSVNGKRNDYVDGIEIWHRNGISVEHKNGAGNELENGIRSGHSNRIGKEHKDKIGKEHESGIGKKHENGVGNERQNGIGNERQNGIGKEHENGIGNERQNGIGKEHENGIGNEHQNGIGKEHENGIGNERQNGIGKEHENGIGNERQNGIGKEHENGIGNEHQNGIGNERQNGIGKEHENGIRTVHNGGIGKEYTSKIRRKQENGVGYEHEKGIGIEHNDGIRIPKKHQNGCAVTKGHKHESEIECGNSSDNLINYVPFESFVDVVVDRNLPVLPEFDELQLTSQDVAMIELSSGTTGLQKAIALSHMNLQAEFIIASDERVKKVSDGQIVFAPFSHLAGGVMTLFALALGYTCHIMTRFQLEPYLKALSEYKNESIAIVPSIALSLAKAPEVINYDLSSLKEILCGTARLSSHVERQLSSRFPGSSVRQGYGLTETTAICACVPRNLPPHFARSKSGSIGVPLYNVEIKIVDSEFGAILGPRQNGELLVRSPLVMKGYKNRWGITTSGVIDDDGWLHTGDLCCYDDDGYLWFSDRIKDLMRCASFQVSPSELESILLTHGDVADAAVFALHDGTGSTPDGDDHPAAWVVRKPGGMVTEDELDLHVSSRVASYKRLCGGITFVESIPRTSNGKILRLKIQQLATPHATHT